MRLSDRRHAAIGKRRPRGRFAALRTDLLAEHLGISSDTFAARFAKKKSLIAAIESFATSRGRGLVPFVPERPGAIERKLARNEVLDPESAGEAFEPMARPGLFAGLGFRR